MVFTSPVFVFLFLPLTLLGYYLIRSDLRNLWLLLCSLFFYAWGEPVYVFLMLLSICVNYCLGRTLEKVLAKQKTTEAKIALTAAVLYNLAALGYFKYADFLIRNVNRIFRTDFPLRNIGLPIGISFFTFQLLSYVIDVYRGEGAQHNILDLALYISFFPQLIAGPIVRYSDIRDQLKQRQESSASFFQGIILFMIGFSKKVLLADQLAPLADRVFDNNGYSTLAALTGAAAYTLQIYFDFSGYSDMAIGLGRMFGFSFKENFDYPYRSGSIREFWRRWHISLSTWFRDYVYIPLGGSRVPAGRRNLNLLLVFFLTGLWHGASWNFIAWGLYYGLLLVNERAWLGNVLTKLPTAVGRIYSLVVIGCGWILFRANGFMCAMTYLRNVFNWSDHVWIDFASNVNRQYVFLLIAGTFFSMVPVGRNIYEKCCSQSTRSKNGGGIAATVLVFVTFFVALCYMAGSGFSPFLYFRF